MSFNPATAWADIIGWSRPPQEFTEPEQLLSAFFAASNVGLSIVDTQLNYQAINKSLAEMNGFPVEAHLGKSMRDILGNAVQAVEPIMRRVLLTGEPVTNVPLALQLPTRPDVGHWVVHYFPMNDASGRVTRIGVVVVEVTEQKKLEDQLGSLASKLKKEKDRLRMLLEIGTILNSGSGLQNSFPNISAAIRKVMEHDWADLSLLDESSASIKTYAADYPPDSRLTGPENSTSLKDSLSREAIAERQPRILSSSELRAFDSSSIQQLVKNGIQSVCCVPFTTSKGLVGSLNLGSVKRHAFQSEDFDLLKLVGLHLANAIDISCDGRESSGNGARRALGQKTETRSLADFEEIVGKSPVLKKVLDQCRTVAKSDARS
jgi:PAS domain S-box-containing protein